MYLFNFKEMRTNIVTLCALITCGVALHQYIVPSKNDILIAKLLKDGVILDKIELTPNIKSFETERKYIKTEKLHQPIIASNPKNKSTGSSEYSSGGYEDYKKDTLWKYAVQISSQRSEASAKASYLNIKLRYYDIFKNKTAVILKATISGKGTFYRVAIQSKTKDAASKFCAELKRAGGACFVSKQYHHKG